MKRFSLLFQKPLMAISSLTLAILYAIALPALALLIQWITNTLVEKQEISSAQVMISLGFAVAVLGISALYVYVKDRLINSIIRMEKNRIFTEVFSKNISDFRKNNTSVYTSVLNQDIYIIEDDYFETLYSIVGGIATVIAAFVIMWFIYYKIIFIMLGLVIAGLIIPNLLGTKMGKYKNEYLVSFGQFNGVIKDYFNAFEVIKAYRVLVNVINSFGRYNNALESKRLKSKLFEDIVLVVSNFAAFMLSLAMFLICAYYVSINEIRVGDMVAVVQLSNSIMSPIMMILLSLGRVISAKKVWNNIDEIKLRKSGVHDIDIDKLHDTDRIQFSKSIEFKDVSFAYPGKEQNTLQDINIAFEKGKKYAIVGMSGSGKTTLLKMILRYFDNYSGSISIDGYEYSKIDDESVYDNITYMQQHSVMFNDTLEYNLTLGNTVSDNLLDQAIDKANLRKTVDKLAKGLKTIVQENGINFSGGEKKRIEICRALLKKSDIVIVDEFSFGLDNLTAKILERELVGLDATVINVTHFLDEDILRLYDEIIVLEDGSIREVGCFDELYDNGSLFYRLIEKGGEVNEQHAS
ncbi:ABC transporter ATP-binding protein [Veillonella rodentium]|uniref:Putative multidrug export ATP-binding/permease protein SAV1866 n=1 Tax=Veillonella rodentium TaxID=248315 RepID=A0A239YAY2_9FIRM|nr:ABC transporter ATP-binding protein [Veillonella rodentium]SNV55852.1 Putative multidrug export ATP-binding/permease protein SAV1866 [Veillonella rodentium]